MNKDQLAVIAPLLNIPALKKELASLSLYQFVKQAWSVIESDPFVDGNHIKIVCDTLQNCIDGEGQNVVINIPPRSSKSLITCVFFPVWVWIKHPELRFLTASYSKDLATRDAVKSRRLIDSAWYQSNWSDKFKLSSDQNQKTKYENDHGGHRIVCSPDSTTTGEGGDILLVDDPISAKDAYSATERASVLTWWDQSFYNRLNNPKTGLRIIIAQRLHDEDLCGHVLSTGNFNHVCLPAEYDPDITTHSWPGYEQEGDLLSPERLPKDVLEEYKRTQGSLGYAAQYGQRTAPAEGNLVKKAWLQYYTTPPDRFDTIIQSWDLTFGKSNTSDYVVGAVLGKRGANIYLIDLVRDRMDFPEQIKAIKALSAKYPLAQTKLIENKANGAAAISTLRNEIPGLIPVNPTTDKIARLNAVLPTIESGNFFIPLYAPYKDLVEAELTRFPNAQHDDIVDAISQGLNRLISSAYGGIIQSSYI